MRSGLFLSMMAFLGAASAALAEGPAPAKSVPPARPAKPAASQSESPATSSPAANNTGGLSYSAFDVESPAPAAGGGAAAVAAPAANGGDLSKAPSILQPGCSNGCDPRNQFYGSAEFILWRMRSSTVPPFVGAISNLGLFVVNTTQTFINGNPPV